jgi:hypothetical protein
VMIVVSRYPIVERKYAGFSSELQPTMIRM